jgi:prophage DNA circulation protein
MSENEKIQKDKEITNLKEQLKISKKEIEAKQISIDELKKNNDLLIQEKEQLFCDYQKKIEMLQLKMLDSTSAESSSDGITRAIEIINENVDEFKNIFKKKFDSFVENFNQFKKEYLDRNDELINLLNDKTKNISNEVQKYSKSAQSDIETIFNNVNKAGNSIHEQTIEFYKKQVSKLSECQKSDISNKTKIEILNNEINNLKNQLKVSQELNVDKDKLVFLKDEQLNKKLDYITKIEAILSDMKNFMYSNMNEETLELFNKNFNTPV